MQLQKPVVEPETSIHRTGISLITVEQRGAVSATWSASELVRRSHSSERGSWGRKEARNSSFCFIANDKEQKSVKEHDLGQYSYFVKVCVS